MKENFILSLDDYKSIRSLMAYISYKLDKSLELVFAFMHQGSDIETEKFKLHIEISDGNLNFERCYCFDDFNDCLEWLKSYKLRLDRPKSNMLHDQIKGIKRLENE